MHGFASNVLSCEVRERLAQELFEARYAGGYLSQRRHLMDREGLRFVAYARIDPRFFPAAPVVVAEAIRLDRMNFLLFSTEV